MPLPSTSSTVDSYGGIKVNEFPVEDPQSSLGADSYNQAISDLSQVSRMTDLGWVMFDGYTGTASITPRDHEALWGRSTAPTVVYSVDGYSQGTYTITLPATWTDALDVVHSVNLRGAFSVNYGRIVESAAGELLDIQVRKTGSNTFKVIVRNYTGTADPGESSTITVHYK